VSEVHSSRRYSLRITGPAARGLAGKVPEKVATAVYEFITTALLDNPQRVGKQLLLPSYEGTWSARRGTYRVLYEIDDEQLIVTVTVIEHRADVYRSR
jgi:mRNA-degrading endonuclease RelE of RelBE toxin-antitoxin system